MAGQPESPAPKRPRISGKLTLPRADAGMNRTRPNDRPIEGKGPMVGPDKPPDDDGAGGGKKRDVARHGEILARIMKRMDRCISSDSDTRKAEIEDRKFMAGEQWPADVLALRNAKRRPALTNNRMPTFVHQVTNPARENRPQINVSPLGERTEKQAARILEGLIRSIERDSHADIAYDSSLSDAVISGRGYMRLTTEWRSETSFDQVLMIKRVRNPFTVYLDPDCQEPDGSDARFAIITELVPEDEFKNYFPGAQALSFDQGGAGEKFKNWTSKDGVRVAEYYEVVEEPRDLVSLSTGYVGWKDEIDDIAKYKLASGSAYVIDERESFDRKVKYYKASALEILEEEEWIGRWVPIIRVVGDELDLEGRVKYWGIVRNAKDAQRMCNYWDCLDIATPIPTTGGWKPMEQIGEGDTLYDERGEETKVVGVGPIHIKRECYKITFDDGSHIVADDGHLWAVHEKGKRKSSGDTWTSKVIPTRELDPVNHRIPRPLPLKAPTADLPIDPYVLGLWLGDGAASSGVLCGNDLEEMRPHLEHAGHPLGAVQKDKRHGTLSASVLGLKERLRKAGVLGSKRIPAAYLRASEEQRRALLQGLMDTDGSCAKSNRQCSFTTVSSPIATGMAELLSSMGIKYSVLQRDRGSRVAPQGIVNAQPCWQFDFTAPAEHAVFRLRRKLAMQFKARARLARSLVTGRFTIRSIERVASVPVKCIAVDSPSHLFLAGRGMVPTHNTSLTEFVALAPKAPYIMEEGQLEGHETEWQTSHLEARPVLTYKGTSLDGHMAPPPQRAEPPQVPAGVLAAKQAAEQNMMATTGIRFDSTLQERMYDESGKALRELNRKTDLGAFHFYDNFSHALTFLGKQMIDIIPKLYNRRQIVTILREDGKEEAVTLDPQMGMAYRETPSAKGTMRHLNPKFGEYQVAVDVGPSYVTRRQEAATSMMDFVKSMPSTAQLVMDLIAAEMDWPGAEKIAARLAKAIPAQLLTADLKDVPPQIQALIANLEAQSKQLTLQLQQTMKELGDKQADRDVALSKINADFEAKLLNMLVKSEDVAKRLAADSAKFAAESLLEEMRASAQRSHEMTMAAQGRETPPDAGKKPENAP